MPDITMCVNSTCPMKKNCYRWKAKAKEFNQSYAHFEPVETQQAITCEYLMDIRLREKPEHKSIEITRI